MEAEIKQSVQESHRVFWLFLHFFFLYQVLLKVKGAPRGDRFRAKYKNRPIKTHQITKKLSHNVKKNEVNRAQFGFLLQGKIDPATN